MIMRYCSYYCPPCILVYNEDIVPIIAHHPQVVRWCLPSLQTLPKLRLPQPTNQITCIQSQRVTVMMRKLVGAAWSHDCHMTSLYRYHMISLSDPNPPEKFEELNKEYFSRDQVRGEPVVLSHDVFSFLSQASSIPPLPLSPSLLTPSSSLPPPGVISLHGALSVATLPVSQFKT